MSKNPLISKILSSPCGALNPHLQEYDEEFKKLSKYGKLSSQPKKQSKEKEWLLTNLSIWCQIKGYELQTEYKFHPARKFKFDYAISELMVSVEYEGLVSKKSRHTTITGYSNDCAKYNLATSMGWRVLRVTALNYQSIIETLNNIK